jgi:branched-subunit amino acid aminotransferase/4-amino-4-deoxychorismate lyase
LLDLHLERLLASARYFGFKANEIKIKQYLEDLSRTFSGNPQRVRLDVNRRGEITHQAAPFRGASSTAVRLAFSRTPVNSQDRMIYHKTTLRQTYDNALHSTSGADDALLWNERGEITETTIANIVLDIDDTLVTPPVFSGLLPGVMRRHLIESGTIAERALTKEDVVRAKRIFRINSVRKWEECEFVGE